jgi:hypothetical protein
MTGARGAGLLAIALVGSALLGGCAGSGEPPVPPGLSDDQAIELSRSRYEYDLKLLLQEFPTASVPDVEPVTMVASRSEWSVAQVTCLVGRGIRGATTTPGGYAVQGGNDPQAEAIARFACRYQFPIDPRVLGALSAEQAGYAWDYLVGRVMPCMRRLGFQPSPPASREDFIAYSEHVWGSVLWSPYGSLDDPFSGPDRALIDSRCPPLPDDPFAVFNGTLNARISGES